MNRRLLQLLGPAGLSLAALVTPVAHADLVVSFNQGSYSGVIGDDLDVVLGSTSANGDCLQGGSVEYRVYLRDGATDHLVVDWTTDTTVAVPTYLDNGFEQVALVDGPSSDSFVARARCLAPPTGAFYTRSEDVVVPVSLANGPITIEDLVTFPQALDAIEEGDRVNFTVETLDPDAFFDPRVVTWSVDGGPVTQAETIAREFDDGAHEVLVSVSDGDGSSDTRTFPFQVQNVPPDVFGFFVSATGEEGQPVPLQVQAFDKYDDVTFLWTVDGQTFTTASADWAPSNQGSFQVALEVSDGTDVVTRSATVDVSNVAPQFLSTTIPTDIPEGSVAMLSTVVGDPVDDVTVMWTMPGGAVLEGTEVMWTAGNQINAFASLAASDDVDTTVSQAFVRVVNVEPSVVVFDVPSSVDEGDTATLTALAEDPYDAVSYRWEIDGQLFFGPSVDYTFTRAGDFDVTLTVSDDTTGVSQSATVEVENVAPTVSVAVVPADPDEGQSATVTVDAEDVGDGQLTFYYDFGDGTVRTTNQDSVQHTWADSGTYTMSVRAEDTAGASSTDSIEVTVGNLAPTITSVFAPGGSEGVPTNFSATATDPGTDTLTYTWNFGDGSATVQGREVSHTYNDDQTYTVTVTVDDGDGGSDVETRDVLIRNSPPVAGPLQVVAGTPVEEGTLTFEVVASDVPGDPITYEWDLGDGTTDTTSDGTYVHTYPDNGLFQVEVVIRDDEGLGASRRLTLQIQNLAPVISAFSVGDGDPGEPIPFSVTASDVAADTLTYAWDFGDGGTSDQPSGTHTFATDGVYTVTVEVTDEDGGISRRSDTIPIGDVDIVLEPLPVPDPIDEGGSVEITADATSFQSLPLTYTWDPGDGSDPVVGATLQHTYADDGLFTAELTVTDGTNVVVATVDVEVRNVAPILGVVDLPEAASEGDAVTFHFPATDPGDDELVWAWTVDGQTRPEVGDTLEVQTTDDGDIVLEVVVSDGDGGQQTDVVTLSVANVAPTGVISGDADDSGGQPLTFHVDITEPGDDTVRIDWDFGDGIRKFDDQDTISHTYDANGNYTVSVTLRDEDGGLSTATFPIVIDEIGPIVSLFIVPSSTNEGQPVDLRCVGFDLGGSGGVEVLWDLGNGESSQLSQLTYAWPDDGLFTARCTVTDLDGRTTTNEREVDVRNVAPLFSQSPATLASEGALYTYDPRVSDPGDDTITFTYDLPVGAEVDPVTGVITWLPGPGTANTYNVSLTASDEDGGERTVSWALQVVFEDADGDGLPDPWEEEYNFDGSGTDNSMGDPDGDGRNNLQEYQDGTNPRVDDRPTQPVAVSPLGGIEVAVVRPTLTFETSTSPVNSPLTYDVQVFATTNTSATPVAEMQGVTASGAEGTWMVSVALGENRSYYWRVRAFDGFGASPWTAVGPSRFFVNAVEEPPAAPVLVQPADGTVSDTLTPTLVARANPDPDGDPVTLTIVVEDEGGNVIASSGPRVPTAGDASYTVPTNLLTAGETYTWYAYATDDTSLDSADSGAFTFSIEAENAAPSSPVITSPLQDEIVDILTPSIVVTNGVDPEGDALQVVFEVAAENTYQTLLASDAVPAGAGGTTTWTVNGLGLAEDQTHWVRARMEEVATGKSSGWDEISFFASENDDPPGTPGNVAPSDGFATAVGVTDVTLEVTEVTDPEGTDVQYVFRLVNRASPSTPIEIGPVADTDTDVDTITAEATGLAPGVYDWSAQAIDGGGVPSPYGTAFELTVTAAPHTGDTETGDTETGDTETDDTSVDTQETDTGEETGDSGPDTEPDTDDTDDGDDVKCGGCASSGPGVPALWLVAFAVAGLRRRRRG